jgi:hypothetical protein
MKYYLDTEFHEYEKNGINTIELISIGIVAEDGREYYAVCNDFDIHAAMENEWLRKNVLAPIHIELEPEMEAVVNEHYGTTGRQIAQWDQLFNSEKTKSKSQIAKEIKQFCSISSGFSDFENPETSNVVLWVERNEDVEHELKHKGVTTIFEGPPEFYAYYADYDWVVFCWLFGRMIDLPEGFPMYCRDLKQMIDDKCDSINKEAQLVSPGCPLVSHKTMKENNPNYPTQDNEHNALDDAKWNKRLHDFLLNLK